MTRGKLEIDHIISCAMGGETSIENSQTLCNICNNHKEINELDFRCNTTQLKGAKNLDLPNLDVSTFIYTTNSNYNYSNKNSEFVLPL